MFLPGASGPLAISAEGVEAGSSTQASRSSPGPTATSTQPARLSGSPIPLASHDAVHRPARSTPAKAAAAPSDPRTPRWNTPRWKARL